MSKPTNRREELRRQQAQAAARSRMNRIVGIGAAVLAVILAAVIVVVIVQSTSSPSSGAVTPPNVSAKKDAIVVNPGKAPAGAPTVTLYLDYQCPNCKSFEEAFGPMLAQSAQAGDWTLQHKTMTFMDDNIGNTASTRAALGAACAADAGHYLDYSTQVYAHQAAAEVRGAEGYSDALLRAELPAAVGITGDALTAFQACYDGRATQDFVAGVNASAGADGVRGTPTLAINGTPVDFNAVTPFTPDGLKAYILAHA